MLIYRLLARRQAVRLTSGHRVVMATLRELGPGLRVFVHSGLPTLTQADFMSYTQAGDFLTSVDVSDGMLVRCAVSTSSRLHVLSALSR